MKYEVTHWVGDAGFEKATNFVVDEPSDRDALASITHWPIRDNAKWGLIAENPETKHLPKYCDFYYVTVVLRVV